MKYKLFLLIVLITGMFVQTNNANAQSIPLLTDPIKVREIELISVRLDMTTSQQEALLGVYDAYLEDFARVRMGEIKDFQDDIATAAETFGFMNFEIPERTMVEDLIRKAERAIRAIHRSDNLFFEEVSGMLTEKQRVDLNRIKIARELEAYQLFIVEMLGGINRGARAQLSVLYTLLDTEQNIEIDEALDVYDKRYLKQAKEGFDAVVATVRLALDQIDELNVRGMNQQALMMRFMADPEAMEDLKKRGELLVKPLVAQAYEMSQLNWKTWNKIDALLDEEDAQKLQEWYFGKSFRDAVRGGSRINDYIDKAIAFKSISEGQRIDLQELQQSFLKIWSNMTEKHAEVLEKSRQNLSIAMMSGDVTSGFEEQLSTMKDSRREYIDKMESRIDAILGKELAMQLQGNKPTTTFGPFPFVTPANGTEMTIIGGDGSNLGVAGATGAAKLSEEELQAILQEHGEDGEVFVMNSVPSSTSPVVIGQKIDMTEVEIDFKAIETLNETQKQKIYGSASIPKPIAPSFPERAAIVLELDESGVLIIEAVYNEYREKYDEAYETIASGSKKVHEDLSLGGGERMRKNNDLSKAAGEAVAALDIAFYDDLVAVTSLKRNDANVMMLENHRERQRTSVPADPFGWRGGDGDTIDLVGLYVMSNESDALQEGISAESITAIRTAMQGYHEQVVGPHGQFAQATADLTRMEDAMWLMDENGRDSAMAESIQKRWRDAFTSIRDSKRALMLANQNVMDSLLKHVLESDFWKVRMEFVKRAYPDVFKKSNDLAKMLHGANAIQNLDLAQKEKIQTLTSTYRYDYWDLCESMIENHQSDATASSGDGFVDKEDVHRKLQLEVLRFQRGELNDRLQMRLRMILSEDQIKEVPGLPPSVTFKSQYGLK